MRYNLLILFVLFFGLNIYASETSKIDSLENKIKTEKQDTLRIKLLYQLSKEFYRNRDFKKALLCNEQRLALVKKAGTPRDLVVAYSNIGTCYNELAFYDKAIAFYYKALQTCDKYKIHDDKIHANVFRSIGMVYDNLNNSDLAQIYYTRSLEIYKKMKSESGIANCLSEIGIIYDKEKKYTEALRNYRQANLLYIKLQDAEGDFSTNNNIGLLYQNTKRYDSALYFYNKCVDIANQMKADYLLIPARLNLGNLYNMTGKYALAYSNISQGLALAKSQAELPMIQKGYEYLSDYYSKVKDFEKAYKYLDKSAVLKDSLYSSEMNSKTAEMQAKYEFEKNEADNERLQRENVLQSLTLSKKTSLIHWLIFTLALLILASAAIIRNTRIKKRTAEELRTKNIEIEKQKKELESLVATKDKFFSIIAHDLKSPFNSLLGFSDLLYESFSELDDTEKYEYIEQVHHSSQGLFELLENLLQWSRAQMGKMEWNPEKVDMKKIFTDNLSILQIGLNNKMINIESDLNSNATVYADPNMVLTIVRNLLTNALKFTDKGGIIQIHSTPMDGQLKFTISDNGMGISEENQKKLFLIDEKFKTNGTAGEKGTGLGLLLCKEFVKINKGEIWVESELGKGSSFSFTLPVYSQN
jgi:signal transduction histidine kinase